MHIEINAGGEATVQRCCSCLNVFQFDTEAILSRFISIRKQMENLNGGIGALETAYEDISRRISGKTEQIQQAREVRASFLQFVAHAEKNRQKGCRSDTCI